MCCEPACRGIPPCLQLHPVFASGPEAPANCRDDPEKDISVIVAILQNMLAIEDRKFIKGHRNIYVNNSSRNQGRAVTIVCECIVFVSSRRIDWYVIWPTGGSFTRSGHLTWPKVKLFSFKFTFWVQDAYVSMRLNERNVMASHIFLYLT